MQNSAAFSVYKSSAGSGKTYTLIQSYLTLALSTESASYYQSVLAITFTNKAANEMKTRVLSTLEKMARYPQVDSGVKGMMEFIQNTHQISLETIAERANNTHHHILHHFHLLSIMTIDKFSLKIVQTFAKDLNLPMSFGIELDAGKIKKEITSQLIDDLTEEKPEYKLLIDFIQKKISENKNWDIRKTLEDFSGNIFRSNDLDFIKAASEIKPDDVIAFTRKKKNELFQLRQSLKQEAQSFINTAHSLGLEAGDFHRSNAYNHSLKLVKGNKIELPSKALDGVIFEKEWLLKPDQVNDANSVAANETLLPMIQSLVNHSKEAGVTIVTLDKLLENSYFVGLIAKFQTLFMNYKAQNNIIHISEVEDAIHQIVTEDPIPYLYERVGNKYNHLLIDEFQDTSVKQWGNLLPLVDHHLAENHYNMIVGDGKQSIYRFRGGEVNQFNNLPQLDEKSIPFAAERQHNFSTYYEELNLDTNYRSTKTVVEFNNEIIPKLVHLVDDERVHQIYDGTVQKIANPKEGYVELSVVKIKDVKKELDITETEIINRYTLEKINQCLDDGYLYEDIAILDRKNSTLKEIASYLSDISVPIVSAESLLLKNSAEVMLIMHAFKAIQYPNEKQYAAQWAKAYATLHEGIQYQNLVQIISENKQFWKALQQKLNFNFIDVKSNGQLYDNFEKLIRLFNLNSKSNTFLNALGEWIFQTGAKFNNNLAHLLDVWEQQSDKLSVSTQENVNAVTLMSIHKSKGLEFPVVIAPRIVVENTNISDKWVLTEEEELPVSQIKLTQNLEDTRWKSVYEQEKKDTDLDEINSFYVLSTRPVDRFYGHVIDNNRQSGLHANFIGCIENMEGFDAEKQQLIRGEQSTVERKISENLNTLDLPSFYSFDINDRLKVNLSEDGEPVGKAKKFGDSIHAIMANTFALTDFDTAWNLEVDQIELSIIEKQSLKSELIGLMEHPELKHLFDVDQEVYNERDFLNSDGNVVRADRINVYANHIEVTDYKTGTPNLEHQFQLENYMAIFEKVFDKKAKGRLVYLSPFNIVEL